MKYLQRFKYAFASYFSITCGIYLILKTYPSFINIMIWLFLGIVFSMSIVLMITTLKDK